MTIFDFEQQTNIPDELRNLGAFAGESDPESLTIASTESQTDKTTRIVRFVFEGSGGKQQITEKRYFIKRVEKEEARRQRQIWRELKDSNVPTCDFFILKENEDITVEIVNEDASQDSNGQEYWVVSWNNFTSNVEGFGIFRTNTMPEETREEVLKQFVKIAQKLTSIGLAAWWDAYSLKFPKTQSGQSYEISSDQVTIDVRDLQSNHFQRRENDPDLLKMNINIIVWLFMKMFPSHYFSEEFENEYGDMIMEDWSPLNNRDYFISD